MHMKQQANQQLRVIVFAYVCQFDTQHHEMLLVQNVPLSPTNPETNPANPLAKAEVTVYSMHRLHRSMALHAGM